MVTRIRLGQTTLKLRKNLQISGRASPRPLVMRRRVAQKMASGSSRTSKAMKKLGNVFHRCARWWLGESFYSRKAYEREWHRHQWAALRAARREEIAGQRDDSSPRPQLTPISPQTSRTLTPPLGGFLAPKAPIHFIIFRDAHRMWCAAAHNFRDGVFSAVGRGHTRLDAIVNLLEQCEFREGEKQGRWPRPTLDDFIEVAEPEDGKSREIACDSDAGVHQGIASLPQDLDDGPIFCAVELKPSPYPTSPASPH